MAKAAECCTTHLIEGNGTFNAHGLDKFINQVNLEECGVSYVIVAVMGPQSSGKSTLLNHLFHTNFVEMDADMGRTQTTQGIWIARCTGIEPCTIVMDIEGTDGQERGQDDTTFEKQSALFAMAVSDIVILNMWCHDIGREHAANKPLLKTVFEVMLRIFSPRKKTLMFVIRDKTKSPLHVLDDNLKKDINKIWDSVPKPEAYKGTPLSQLFNVEVVALSNYEENEEQFKEEVASLRQKFFQSIEPGGLAGDRQGVVPASGFSLSSKDIWKVVKENKDLNLPSHTIMVATIRCEEIVSEIYSSFVANKDWLELEEDVKSHFLPGFGKTLSSLLHNCLSNYDEEVIHYDGTIGSEKRKQLYEKLMQLVQPAYNLMFEHIKSEALDMFKKTFSIALNEGLGFAVAAHDCIKKSTTLFDELCEDATNNQANLDSTKIRDKFTHDLDAYTVEVRAAKLYELTKLYELKIEEALISPVEALLEVRNDDTWRAIRMCLHGETETIVLKLSIELFSFEIEGEKREDIISSLKNYARQLVKGKAKYEAGNALGRMKERFIFMFNHDNDSIPRVSWTKNDDIPAIAKTARTSCLKLLSILAAIRLDEDETDTILDTLLLSLVEPRTTTIMSHDPLASGTWEKVTAPNTLITPVQCMLLWNQFQSETEYIINQAIVSQEANNRSNNTETSGFDTFAQNLGIGLGTSMGILFNPFRQLEVFLHGRK